METPKIKLSKVQRAVLEYFENITQPTYAASVAADMELPYATTYRAIRSLVRKGHLDDLGPPEYSKNVMMYKLRAKQPKPYY